MTDRIFVRALLFAPILAVLALPGFGQSQTNQRPHQTAADSSATPMTKAIEMNVAEVDAGKMATQKAQSPKVKEFAEKMVKDHSEALSKLHAVPGAPSDVKPNAKHQQTAERLSKLSGSEFDREYMKTMVADHQQAVRFFEQQIHAKPSGGTVDQAVGSMSLAAVSQELLPTVRQHLQSAEQIQKELNVTSSGSRPKNTNSNSTTRSKPNQTPTPDK